MPTPTAFHRDRRPCQSITWVLGSHGMTNIAPNQDTTHPIKNFRFLLQSVIIVTYSLHKYGRTQARELSHFWHVQGDLNPAPHAGRTDGGCS